MSRNAFSIIFREFLKARIIPTGSVCDAATMHRHSSKLGKGKGSRWLFARHWYSTLVEAVSERRDNPVGVAAQYVWDCKSAIGEKHDIALEIMPIPTSIHRFATRKPGEKVEHHSCWGDWHLGIVRGTENHELAVEIINNLMSSYKICDSAFRGASIPTVQTFFDTYGGAACLQLPVAQGRMKLPSLTFEQLKDDYMRTAKSRSRDVFDYRHCMRELHSVIIKVLTDRGIEDADLAKAVNDAIERVKDLRHRTLMFH